MNPPAPPPQGFNPETWAALTPEQQAPYLQAAQPGAAAAVEAQAQALKRQVWYSVAFSMLGGLLSRLLGQVLRRDD